MGFTTDLLAAVAQLLEDEGAGTFRDDGSAYLAAEIAIAFGVMPAAPDRVILLTAYDVANDPTAADSVQGLQVRTRGTKDPRVVDALDDAVFDALQALPGLDFATGRVLLASRNSSTPLGPDGNGRHERSSNWYLTTHRPAAHRL